MRIFYFKPIPCLSIRSLSHEHTVHSNAPQTLSSAKIRPVEPAKITAGWSDGVSRQKNNNFETLECVAGFSQVACQNFTCKKFTDRVFRAQLERVSSPWHIGEFARPWPTELVVPIILRSLGTAGRCIMLHVDTEAVRDQITYKTVLQKTRSNTLHFRLKCGKLCTENFHVGAKRRMPLSMSSPRSKIRTITPVKVFMRPLCEAFCQRGLRRFCHLGMVSSTTRDDLRHTCAFPVHAL